MTNKTLFLAIFDSRSSIVKSVFDCRLSGVNSWAAQVLCNGQLTSICLALNKMPAVIRSI